MSQQTSVFVGGFDGFRVFNVSNPRSPQQVGRHPASEWYDAAHEISVSDNYAWIRNGFGSLTWVDISDPRNPKRAGILTGLPECLSTVAISGKFVYLVAFGFHVHELRSLNPRLEALRSIEPGTFRLRVDGPRGVKVRLQRSANLLEWQDWQSVTVGDSPIEILDSNIAGTPRQFYRASTP